MKRTLLLILALTLPSLLSWAAVGFVAWNWSPETWSEAMRATFVMVSIMLTMPAIAFFGDIS